MNLSVLEIDRRIQPRMVDSDEAVDCTQIEEEYRRLEVSLSPFLPSHPVAILS